MSPFLVYLIKSTLSLTLLYSLFRLTMRKHKSHAANRFLLLGIIVVSSLIPFIHVNTTPENLVIQKVESITSYFTPSNEYVEPDMQPSRIVISSQQVEKAKYNLLRVFYVSLLILLSLRIAISIFHVFRLIHKAEKTKLQDIILAIIKESVQPFSFMKYIVLSENDHHKNKEILIVHEYEHIRQWHTVDLILVELFTLVHCFNPMAWLLRRDLKLIHEFQADQAVLNKGIDVQKYQLLVLEKAVGERRFAMATHFNQPPVKTRLNMMNKTKEKKWHSLKLILYIPLLLLLLQAFAKPEIIEKVSEISTSITQAGPNENKVNRFVELAMKDIENPKFCLNFQDGRNIIQAAPLAFVMSLRENYTIEFHDEIGLLLQNLNGALLFNGVITEDGELKNTIKSFLKVEDVQAYGDPDLIYFPENWPKSWYQKTLQNEPTILYMYDQGCPKEEIEETVKSIGEAIYELRQEIALQLFNKEYNTSELDTYEMAVLINLIPQNIFVGIQQHEVRQ